MDTSVQLTRTTKGQDEIFNHGHTVRPKCRQILFAIGDGISFGALREKLPNAELETLLGDLQRGGFIEIRGEPTAAPAEVAAATATATAAAEPTPPRPATPQASASQPGLARARDHVLDVLAALAGTKSPAYRRMSDVQDVAGFKEALPFCRKMIAAVASPHQAAEMEAQALERLGDTGAG